MREQLVDEYRLMVHPIVFGTGKRLFRDATTFSRLALFAFGWLAAVGAGTICTSFTSLTCRVAAW
jgi:hypothetical protein